MHFTSYLFSTLFTSGGFLSDLAYPGSQIRNKQKIHESPEVVFPYQVKVLVGLCISP